MNAPVMVEVGTATDPLEVCSMHEYHPMIHEGLKDPFARTISHCRLYAYLCFVKEQPFNMPVSCVEADS